MKEREVGTGTNEFHLEEVGPRVHKYSAPFTQREWLSRLQTDETLVMDFVALLQKSPFKAFFFEMPRTDLYHLDQVTIMLMACFP